MLVTIKGMEETGSKREAEANWLQLIPMYCWWCWLCAATDCSGVLLQCWELPHTLSDRPSTFCRGLNLYTQYETGSGQNQERCTAPIFYPCTNIWSTLVLDWLIERKGSWPWFLVDRLLPHGHVLGIFLQPVKRRVRLHADAVVMILRVASGSRARQKAETSEKEKSCQCYRHH